MSKNKVVWIDDNEFTMKTVVNNIFEELWEQGIKSEIYIFGDYASSESNYNKAEAIKNLNSVTYDKFISFLINQNCIDDDPSVNGKWYLINSKSSDKSSANIATDKIDILDKHKEIIKKWKELEKFNKDSKSFLVEFDLQDLVNDLIVDKSDIIMLDLCLMQNDLSKLYEVNPQKTFSPVLSMGIYYTLKNIYKCNVFLYTTYVSPNDIIKSWTTTYKELYNDSTDIIIYDRAGNVSNKESGDGNLIDAISKVTINE